MLGRVVLPVLVLPLVLHPMLRELCSTLLHVALVLRVLLYHQLLRLLLGRRMLRPGRGPETCG